MIYTTEKLKYLNIMIDVIHFESGLSTYPNIDQLYKTKIKNKVICKIDLTTCLSDIFSNETMATYRDLIISMAQGTADRNIIPDILTALLETDKTFRSGINILFNECPPSMTFGDYISIGLARRIVNEKNYICESFVGKPEFVICESNGYLYISCPDESNYELQGFKYEVISYAKNWLR